MDPITLRFIERFLVVIIGGMTVFLGYLMFLKIPESRDGQGKLTLPWNITVALSRVGPGVFFALFGASVVAFSLYNQLELSEHNAKNEVSHVKWVAAPTPEDEKAARADARALLRRDIGILNNLTNSLRSDLPEHERTPIELAIPRIKFALMKAVWGEPDAGWGTPIEFEAWIKDGEPYPAPRRIVQAVEYYAYAKGVSQKPSSTTGTPDTR